MKIGDILICKKGIAPYGNNWLTKNKSYCVMIIDYSSVYIIDDMKEMIDYNRFYDYFYTKEELRQLKIDSI